MKRYDLLRKLNDIQLQIGRLMEITKVSPEEIADRIPDDIQGAVNYYSPLTKLISSYTDKIVQGDGYISNKDLHNMSNIIANGYDVQLIKDVKGSMVRRDIEKRRLFDNIDRTKSILDKIDKMRTKRDVMADAFSNDIKKYKEKYAKDADFFRKAAESAKENEVNNRKKLAVATIIISLLAAVAVCYLLGSKVVEYIKTAISNISEKGIFNMETLISCLKAVGGVAVIAAPICIAAYVMFKWRGLTSLSEVEEQKIDNDFNKRIYEMQEIMVSSIKGAVERYKEEIVNAGK